MKILIASQVEDSLDKKVQKWIKNISNLEYVADVLILDYSPSIDYVKKIERYCKKNKLQNYKVLHVSISQHQPVGEKLGRCREAIRQEILFSDYDLWFQWDCKYALPTNIIQKLKMIMDVGDYDVVSHVPSINQACYSPENLFGVDLITKASLKKYGFLLEYPDMPDYWHGNGLWFKQRIVRDGGKCIELDINNPEQIKDYQEERGLKLNLGCGNKHKPGYVNIDIQQPCDLKHDLTTPLPFADSSVDEIYTEGNVVSLFSRTEWDFLKKEMGRVLKPGGKVEIIFIDFEYVLKAFLENKNGERWSWWIKTIFSGQHNRYEFSKNGFTYDKLLSDLSEVGFEKFFKKKHEERLQSHLVGFKKFLTYVILIFLISLRVVSTQFLTNIIASINNEEGISIPSTPKGKQKRSKLKSSPQFLVQTIPLRI